MIFALLKLILIFFIVILVIAGVLAFRLLRSLWGLSDLFRGTRGKRGGNARDNERQDFSTRGGATTSRNTTSHAGKKIFPKSEGEYVDFEEEK